MDTKGGKGEGGAGAEKEGSPIHGITPFAWKKAVPKKTASFF
jgi:hypothetical protein